MPRAIISLLLIKLVGKMMNKAELQGMLVALGKIKELRKKFNIFINEDSLSEFIANILAPLLTDTDAIHTNSVIESVLNKLEAITYTSENYHLFPDGFKIYLTDLIIKITSNHLQKIKKNTSDDTWIDELLSLDLKNPEAVISFLNQLINYADSHMERKNNIQEMLTKIYFDPFIDKPKFRDNIDNILERLTYISKLVQEIGRADLWTYMAACHFPTIMSKTLYIYNEKYEHKFNAIQWDQQLADEEAKYKQDTSENRESLPYGRFKELSQEILEKSNKQLEELTFDSRSFNTYKKQIEEIENHLDNIKFYCKKNDIFGLILAYVKFGEYLQKIYHNLTREEIANKMKEIRHRFAVLPSLENELLTRTLPNMQLVASVFTAKNYLENNLDKQKNNELATVLDALDKALYSFNTLKGTESCMKAHELQTAVMSDSEKKSKPTEQVSSAMHFIRDDIVPNTHARHEVDGVINFINTFSHSLHNQYAMEVTQELAGLLETKSNNFFQQPDKTPEKITTFKNSLSQQVHAADNLLLNNELANNQWIPVKQNALAKFKNLVIHSIKQIFRSLFWRKQHPELETITKVIDTLPIVKVR